MATGDVLNICNRSLIAAGTRSQISSLNEGTPEANSCSILYQPCFESLARSAFWNCLRNQATLSLIAAAAQTPENPSGTPPLPPQPWLYSYELPNDCLQARFLVPTFPASGAGAVPISPAFVSSPPLLPGLGQIPFRVAYGKDKLGNPIQIVLTNQTQAQLVYTVNQSNPQFWDSLFQSAMVASLAAWLIPALNLMMPLMQAQISLAERMIEQARLRDGDEGATSQDNTPDWIRARAGGASYGGNGCGNWYASYDSMLWPG